MFTLNNTKIIPCSETFTKKFYYGVISSAVYGFFLFIILAFVFILAPANTASAYQVYGDVVGASIRYPSRQQTYPVYYQVPVYVQTPAPAPSPTPIVYSTSTNPDAPKAAPKAVAKAKTEEVKKDETKPAEVARKDEVTNKYSDLLAGVIFGTDGFMPSGLTGWTFFAILILGTVMLVRKVFGGSEKYYATPMKHK